MSRKPDVRDPVLELPPDKIASVHSQLEHLLSSYQFRGSRRCQNLLRYMTEQSLLGNTCALKERTLGVEVFGRSPDYDTSQDPVVRATAAEIRKKLAQYYQEPGHEGEPRIELQAGSYVVDFHFNGVVKTEAPPREGDRRHSRAGLWVAGGAVAALVALGAMLQWPRWTHSDLDRLWAPFLRAPGTILLCIGQPATYVLRSAQAQDAIQGIGPPPAEADPSDSIPRRDLVILWDRYITLGDVRCVLELTAFLQKNGKSYHIRGERTTSFADMGENASVLIGAFDNQWTLRAAGQLRYTFAKDSPRGTDLVRDREHPEKTDWKLTGAWPAWDIPADYAIVTRLVHTTTDHPVMIAAGITQYGTMGAGEFMSHAEYFRDVVPKLPVGWENRNLQIVLRIPVESRTVGRPVVLAVHSW